MKLYLVMQECETYYGARYIRGIYQTEELANEALDKLYSESKKYLEIEETNLDEECCI